MDDLYDNMKNDDVNIDVDCAGIVVITVSQRFFSSHNDMSISCRSRVDFCFDIHLTRTRSACACCSIGDNNQEQRSGKRTIKKLLLSETTLVIFLLHNFSQHCLKIGQTILILYDITFCSSPLNILKFHFSLYLYVITHKWNWHVYLESYKAEVSHCEVIVLFIDTKATFEAG